MAIWETVLKLGIWAIDFFVRNEREKNDLKRRFVAFVKERVGQQTGSSEARLESQRQVDELKDEQEVQKEETKRLALIVGHTKQSPGAIAVNPIDATEYEFNCELCTMIQQIGEKKGIETLIFLRDGVGINGAYADAMAFQPDAIVEVHFNAYNSTAQGTEVLFHSDKQDQTEKLFADLLQLKLCDALGREGKTNRGTKDLADKPGERGFFNLTRTSEVPCVLIEPFFGDNFTDAELAFERKENIAKAVVSAFCDWKKAMKG